MVSLTIGLAIAAVLLRASVSLANKFLGRNSGGGGVSETFSERVPDDPANPYATTAYGVASGGSYDDAVIPEPSFGRACGIVLANMVVGFVAGLVVGIVIAASGLPPIAGSVINLVVGFGISVMMYQAMLPTTTGRAALVAVCQYLIMLLIAAIIVGIMLAIGGLASFGP